MNRIDLLTKSFESVRRYTHMTLVGVQEEDWFRVPNGCPTHIAWQIGHIAVGQYGLALASLRGPQPSDEELIPTSFREHFARGSTPSPDPNANPTVELITAVFNRVHDAVVAQLPSLNDQLLDESTPEHPMFTTKFGALLWSIQHEYTHAGQVSLIYRLNGGTPRF